MRVIGLVDDRTYVCVVARSEIEKYLGLYYNKRLEGIKVGSEIDLGAGYDFASQVKEAMTKTRDFVQSNQAVVTAILNGMNLENLMREAPVLVEKEADHG